MQAVCGINISDSPVSFLIGRPCAQALERWWRSERKMQISLLLQQLWGYLHITQTQKQKSAEATHEARYILRSNDPEIHWRLLVPPHQTCVWIPGRIQKQKKQCNQFFELWPCRRIGDLWPRCIVRNGSHISIHIAFVSHQLLCSVWQSAACIRNSHWMNEILQQ